MQLLIGFEKVCDFVLVEKIFVSRIVSSKETCKYLFNYTKATALFVSTSNYIETDFILEGIVRRFEINLVCKYTQQSRTK